MQVEIYSGVKRAVGAMLLSGAVLAGCNGGAGSKSQTVVSPDWPVLAPVEAPEAFDAAGLAALDRQLQQYVSDGELEGVQTLLVKDGKVAHYAAFGVKSTASEAPVTPDTLYRIYSMTKPITGVALMQLYEQGKFELDDPVTKFIPEFEGLKVLTGEHPDGSPIVEDMDRAPTMRELMSHMAGFAYGLGGTDYANRQFREKKILLSPDLDTLIDRVAGVPLLFQPGEHWSYSIAVDIQGYLVEQFSGMDFADYLQANIFDPLYMDDTGFYVPDADYDRLAGLSIYNAEAGGFVEMPTTPETRSPATIPFLFHRDTIAFESGGGGLVSSLDDYARFSQMMLNGGELGGTRLLKPETVALMTKDQLPEGVSIGFDGTRASTSDGVAHKFGLDFAIISDPEAMNSPTGTGTFYWGGAAGTWFWIDPVNDLFFVGMIQRFGSRPGSDFEISKDTVRLVYDALAE